MHRSVDRSTSWGCTLKPLSGNYLDNTRVSLELLQEGNCVQARTRYSLFRSYCSFLKHAHFHASCFLSKLCSIIKKYWGNWYIRHLSTTGFFTTQSVNWPGTFQRAFLYFRPLHINCHCQYGWQRWNCRVHRVTRWLPTSHVSRFLCMSVEWGLWCTELGLKLVFYPVLQLQEALGTADLVRLSTSRQHLCLDQLCPKTLMIHRTSTTGFHPQKWQSKHTT